LSPRSRLRCGQPISFPEWASLLKKTLVWRVVGHGDTTDPAAVYPDFQRLVRFLVDQILAAN